MKLILLFVVVAAFVPLARAGQVTVTVTPNSIEEGEDAVFTFTQTPVSSRVTKVIYYFAGDARYGDDYTVSGQPGVVVIPAGQPSADVVLHARVDGHFDLTEQAKLVVGDGRRYSVGLPKSASVTITDVP